MHVLGKKKEINHLTFNLKKLKKREIKGSREKNKVKAEISERQNKHIINNISNSDS